MRTLEVDVSGTVRRRDEFERLLAALLAARLREIGLLGDGPVQGLRMTIAPLYGPWLNAAQALIRDFGAPADAAPMGTGSDAARAWEEAKRAWLSGGHYVAQTRLAEACMRALPEVFTGSLRATDALFPAGSMELVESVYAGDPCADLFNAVVAETLAGYVRARIAADPQVKLRLVEIGAGTGGTTGAVLQRLAPFAPHLERYAYTDLSQVFLLHARERFVAAHPFVKPQRFDVSRDPAPQGLTPGSFDVAIATNVLHATPAIRETLRNAKALLKRKGLLVVNELNERSVFLHLTFGLLEGWWLAKDKELRIPGSPALNEPTWERVLRDEIGPVRVPLRGYRGLGQVVLIAESDGVVRAKRTPDAPAPAAEEAVPSVRPAAPASEGDLLTSVRRIVRECVCQALKLDPTELDVGMRFADIGVDSLVAVRLASTVNERCGIRLRTTDLFDHSSAADLAAYIVEHHAGSLRFAAREPGPAPTPTTRSDDPPSTSVVTDVSAPTPSAGRYERLLISGPGEVDTLCRVSEAVQALGPREVRVSVRAFALTFGDLLCVRGLYPTMPPYPFTPGIDASGIVVEVGAQVQSVQPGAAVMVTTGDQFGAHATMIVCAEEQVVPKPERISFEDACAVPSVAITALEVFRRANVRRGERVLIQSATGGLGLLLVQLAKRCGADVFATAGSAEKAAYLRSLGVRLAVDHRASRFADEVLAATGGQGVDVVVNTMAGDAVSEGLRSLRPAGRYVELAMTGLKSMTRVDLSAMGDNQSLLSIDMRKLARARPEYVRGLRDEVLALLAADEIRPTVAEVVAFRDFARAYRRLASREVIGRVVVRIEPESVFRGSHDETTVRVSKDDVPGFEPIAIVGMSGRFAASEDLNTFWRHLASGDDLVGPITRWDLSADIARAMRDGQKFCARGSFLSDIAAFDPLFFNISGLEARYMDPQQRLFLEEAWKALEHAGHAGESLRGTSCGVYAGCSAGDYHTRFGSDRPPQSFWGNAPSVIPARIAYHLDLRGPAIGVDAACASSLVALHLACQALRAGEVDLAVAGGVFVQSTPMFHRFANAAGMLSPEGRCHTFDHRADGFVPGEGVGAVVLKRLRDALADRDTIHAVVRGSGTNQDGASNGITAPSRKAQTQLERAVYEKCGIRANELQFIEAHGTGTALGDPIELEALTDAFRVDTDACGVCAIGSVKSNIGHTAAAAGIAGVLKTVLALKHKQLPPSLHFERGNPRIAWAESPFYVNSDLRPWTVAEGHARRAAVSSFGFSGTNAHVVLEEAPAQARGAFTASSYLIVLTARTPASLERRVADLRDRLADDCETDLGDLSFTLLAGRRSLPCRASWVVSSHATLLEALQRWLREPRPPAASTISDDAEHGRLSRAAQRVIATLANEARDTAAYDSSLKELHELHMRGVTFDAAPLFRGLAARIPLPTYPFSRERYWVDDVREASDARHAEGHPFLGQETSGETGTTFHVRLRGTEPFLVDHRVDGRMVMPAVVSLEMARAAFSKVVLGAFSHERAVSVRDVVWLAPVVSEDDGVNLIVTVRPTSGSSASFEIARVDGDRRALHARGTVHLCAPSTDAPVDLIALEHPTDSRRLSATECYAAFERLGLSYGESHRLLDVLHVGERAILAKLRPALPTATSAACVLPPGLFDAALQASLGWMSSDASVKQVPFALSSLDVLAHADAVRWVWVRPSDPSRAERGLDFDLLDAAGRPCVRVRGLVSRALASKSGTDELLLLCGQRRPQSLAFSGTSRTWAQRIVLLCTDDAPYVDAVRARLAGEAVVSSVGTSGSGDVRVLEVLQAVFRNAHALAHERGSVNVLQVVTVRDGSVRLAPSVAALLRAAHHENAGCVGQALELDSWASPGALVSKLDADARYGGQVLVHYEGDERSIERFEPIALQPTPLPPWRDDGVYLISGGLGKIGQLLTRTILRQTSRAAIILLGRSSQADRATDIARLRAAAREGASVAYHEVDIGDANAVRNVVARVRAEHGAIRGVLHCAGVLADGLTAHKSADELAQVCRPKVRGTVALDAATEADPLDFFALFSSVAAPLGSPGQCDYAAANAFMDAYAMHREALRTKGQRRGRSVSIAWPLWAEGGMSIPAPLRTELRTRTGQAAMDTATALEVLSFALQASSTHVVALFGEPARMHAVLEEAGRIVPSTRTPSSGRPATQRDELVSASVALLKEMLCPVLQLPASEIDESATFDRYGIDSVMVVLLTNQLEKRFGPLPKTLFFEHQRLSELADYFAAHHAAQLQPTAEQPRSTGAPAGPTDDVDVRPTVRADEPAPPAVSRTDAAIAIVGLSGRYPGAPTLAAYWENLRAGRDCITEIPASRWDVRKYAGSGEGTEAEHKSRFGGFIDGVDAFDPLFFGISPKEAAYIDPQERLFLEHVWIALEDAGYTRRRLREELKGKVGVYAAVMYGEYQLFGAESSLRGRPLAFASSLGSIANRASYYLDVHGPSLTVDTMCSGSLTSLHLACQDLRTGRTNMGLAGGVNVTIHPNKYLMLSSGSFLSARGHCASFGEGGDGYVPGEGVGIVILKRLADAKRDGDRIYGVIRGTAVNHGGKTNGYTVPNPRAQQAVIEEAMADAHVEPGAVSYVETHGTGTPLGDPIEIAALSKAYGGKRGDGATCWIGSVKSNIGHCEAAAGVAAVSKVLLQLQHGQIAPSLHSARLNPRIDFANTPFRVNQEIRAWETRTPSGTPTPRVAAVSSFGAGGSNAHVLIEEWVDDSPDRAEDELSGGAHAIMLSARTKAALRNYARALAQFVSDRRAHGQPVRLARLAYTLQVGREAMTERLGLIATSDDALAAALSAFGTDCVAPSHQVRMGSVPHSPAARRRALDALCGPGTDLDTQIDDWLRERDLSHLLDAFCAGAEISWEKLYQGPRPSCIAAPTYPFERERYWVPEVQEQTSLGLGEHAHFVREQSQPPLAEGVVQLSLPTHLTDSSANAEFVAALIDVGKRAEAKVLLLRCGSTQPSQEAVSALWRDGVVEACMKVAVPIIGVVASDLDVCGLLMAGACDLLVVDDQARLAGQIACHADHEAATASLLAARFGSALAGMLAEGRLADALREAGALVAPAHALSARAIELARDIAGAPRSALIELKAHFQRARGAALAEALAQRVASPIVPEPIATPALPFSTEGAYGSLFCDERGVAVVSLASAKPGLAERATRELCEALARARQSGCRAVALTGDFRGTADRLVLPSTRSALSRAVAAPEMVFVAAPDADPTAAWELVLSCDLMVLGDASQYSFAAGRDHDADFVDVLRARLGPVFGAEVLLTGRSHSGRALAARMPNAQSAASQQIVARASDLAASWAAASPLAKRLLKAASQRTSEVLAVRGVPYATDPTRAADRRPIRLDVVDKSKVGRPRPVPSEVVALSVDADGLAVITLADRVHRNQFSSALVEGLVAAFAQIEADPTVKVVVLTGYERYFACGGTKESLRAGQQGRVKFNEVPFFHLPLACRVPVIAAMQGHGIGAGWSLGMFADLAVFSAESTYESPYLHYGFTPGAGATLSLPERLGDELAHEILFAARPYKGSELRERGLSAPVVPASAVLAHAMSLARDMCRRSRTELIDLKHQLAQRMRDRVDATYERELAMHAATLVGSAHVQQSIEDRFRDAQPVRRDAIQLDPLPEKEERAMPATSATSKEEQAPKLEQPMSNGQDTAELARRVENELLESLARELQMKPSAVSRDLPFADMGLDSISGATWVRSINARYGLNIDTPKVYVYATLGDFARYVLEEGLRAGCFVGTNGAAAPAQSAPPAPPEIPRAEPAVRPEAAVVAPRSTPPRALPLEMPRISLEPLSAEPAGATAARVPSASKGVMLTEKRVERITVPTGAIAVIGMAGQFPKAGDLDEFWENIAEGRDCISEVPASRWSISQHFHEDRRAPGKTYSKWMGVLEDAGSFDPLFFRISPVEAELIDPQQRVFLQACWHCLEDAGYNPKTLAGSRCGVFAGCSAGDYGQASGADVLNGQRFVGSACSILAARIAYFLDLRGPSVAIDTACSSSLVALAAACDSLLLRRCDAALVGGVSVLGGPSLHIVASKAGMLSTDGVCRPFDQEADGFAPGEGVGVIYLKRLEDALEAGDQIHGVIRGWGVNQDGRSNGITAPNGEAQRQLELEVYERCSVNPDAIQLVEAHGTGTKLGDPVEVAAITQAFRQYTDRRGYCALGSVKSNIGHLAAAAGIAGLLKVLLALKHRTLPPTIHFSQLNEHVRLSESPFYVNTSCRAWTAPSEHPRRAAMSAFGFSGTNAHIVVEEWPKDEPERATRHGKPALVVLSARQPAQLRASAKQLRTYVQRHRTALEGRLESLAHTLQVGREPMKARLGLVASSFEELVARLDDFLEERSSPQLFVGEEGGTAASALLADEDLTDLVEGWFAKGKYAAILSFWVQGGHVDWARLATQTKPSRLSLPGYPFAKETYWLSAPTAARPPAAGWAAHPLVHERHVDEAGAQTSVLLQGSEFFVADHVVTGERVLPAVAVLEMALASAQEQLAAERSPRQRLQLLHVAWMKPLRVQGATRVHMRLGPVRDGQSSFTLESGAEGQRTVHSRGAVRLVDAIEVPPLDLQAIRTATDARVVTRERCYEALREAGVQYGPTFQAVHSIHVGADVALAELRLPAGVAGTLGDYLVHPSLLDACLHASLVMSTDADAGRPALPFALDELEVLRPCTERMWAVIRRAERGAGAGTQVFDLQLCDPEGRPCVRIRRLSARVLANDLRPTSDLHTHEQPVTRLLAPRWAPSEARADDGRRADVERLVLLVGLDGVDVLEVQTALPGVRCERLASQRSALEERFEDYAISLHERLQTLLSRRTQGRVFVQLVIPEGDDRPIVRALGAMLKSAAQENPLLLGQVLSMHSAVASTTLLARLEVEVRGTDMEVRYVGTSRQTLSLLPVTPPDVGQPWRDGGVYLITGGLGGVGAAFAAHILRRARGACVALVGRSEPDAARMASLEAEAARHGGTLTYHRADVADRKQVRALICDLLARYGALHGVLHSAAVLRDGYVVRKSAEQVRAVLAPKVRGAVNLDLETAAIALEIFILFASGVGIAGNPGQADYAAANAFLDGYAHERDALVRGGERHGRTLAIDWAFWAEGGMRVDPRILADTARASGMLPMSTEVGIDALHHALGLDIPQVVVWHGEAARAPADAALLAQASIEPRCATTRPPAAAQPLAAHAPEANVVAPSFTDDRACVLTALKAVLSKVLKVRIEDIASDEPFVNFGIDSLIVADLVSALEDRCGPLPKTLFFEFHTVSELAQHLAETHADKFRTSAVPTAPSSAIAAHPEPEVGSEASPISVPAALPRPTPTVSGPMPIAVVGMAGRYPMADDLTAFWENLRTGRDCVTEIPEARWRVDEYYSEDRTRHGYHFSRHGAFIDDVDKFDARFFGISPKLAPFIDPQERLFMQEAWAAVEDAGYRPEALAGADGEVGVYVGISTGEYQLFGAEASMRGSRMGFATSLASVANRVSHTMNLRGPSMVVDTICSSSLTAIHLACEALRAGSIAAAIAGAVNLSIHPNKYLMLSMGQFLSPRGRCSSFGVEADGYVPGEGVGALVLKPLSAAERDGDHIYGVIRGAAVNHGGRTFGYNVPNATAQARVVGRALAAAQIEPNEVGYIEAHGTGTQLGDPAEIGGLAQVFGEVPRQSCAIGSVKSNIGHLEAASGLAGITKVLLQIKHRQLVPSLHCDVENGEINFGQSPFVLSRDLQSWEVASSARGRRVAGISSFGAGGANAHVIVEEHLAEVDRGPAADTGAPRLVVLSARTPERLRMQVSRLLGHLEREGSAAGALRDLAYTLQVGREPMVHRFGVVVAGLAELRAQLRAFLDGSASFQGAIGTATADGRGARRGDDRPHAAVDLERPGDRRLASLLATWSAGGSVAWDALYEGERPRRLTLPTYPFERLRYWITDVESAMRTEGLPAAHSARASVPQAETSVSASTRVEDAKPSNIVLRDPDGAARPAVRSPVVPRASAELADALVVTTPVDGVMLVRITAHDQRAALARLSEAVARAADDGARVLVVHGLEAHLDLVGASEGGRFDPSLVGASVDCPIPIIAGLSSDLTARGLAAAALFDFVLFAEEGRYGSAADRELTANERELMRLRFGSRTATAVASAADGVTGHALRSVDRSLRVVSRDTLEAAAASFAAELAAGTREAAVALKTQLTRGLGAFARAQIVRATGNGKLNGKAKYHVSTETGDWFHE